MSFSRVHHVGIMVSDMDRSIAWYTEVLGLSLQQRVRLNPGTEVAFLPVGDTLIELIAKTGEFNYPGNGVVNHLAFAVDDVAAVADRLRSQGVEVLQAEPIAVAALGAQVIFFKGPDGEVLELFGSAAAAAAAQ